MPVLSSGGPWRAQAHCERAKASHAPVKDRRDHLHSRRQGAAQAFPKDDVKPLADAGDSKQLGQKLLQKIPQIECLLSYGLRYG
jgi:hypothetical protein